MDDQTKQKIWKQTQVVVFVDDPKSVNGYIANATRNVEALLAVLEAAEAWSAAWKRTAKTRRAWCDRYKDGAEKAEATNARLRAAITRFTIEILPTAQLIQEFNPDTEDHSDTYKMAQHIIDGIGDLNEALAGAP